MGGKSESSLPAEPEYTGNAFNDPAQHKNLTP